MRIGISNFGLRLCRTPNLDLLTLPGWSAMLVAACLAAAGPRLKAADCNSNGVDDAVDIRTGTSADCDSNDVPDECDVEETRLDLGECEIISGDSGVVRTRRPGR